MKLTKETLKLVKDLEAALLIQKNLERRKTEKILEFEKQKAKVKELEDS